MAERKTWRRRPRLGTVLCLRCDRKMAVTGSPVCGLCWTYQTGKLVVRSGELVAVGARGLMNDVEAKHVRR